MTDRNRQAAGMRMESRVLCDKGKAAARQSYKIKKGKNDPGQARYVGDASAPHFLLQAESGRLTAKFCACWHNFGSGLSRWGRE